MNDRTERTLGTRGRLAERLKELWRQGPPPDVHAFLGEAPGLDAAEILAVLRVDQAERWRCGERVPAENYLQPYPQLQAQPELALELIYAEYLLREQLGAAPTLADFVARFPQHAERLRQQVELHQVLDPDTSLNDETWRGGAAEPNFDFTAPGFGAPASPASDSRPPVDVPGYEILRRLGRGGMGVVYLARDKALGRLVALKMLANAYADEEDRARFHIEAAAVAHVHHPNIVQIYSVGEHHGCPFFALEYVEGGTLHAYIAGRPQPPDAAVQLIATLAHAVHHAHQHGILHRDLKPANILLARGGLVPGSLLPGERGRWDEAQNPPLAHQAPGTRHQAPVPKITDFGLAKRIGDTSGRTQTGWIMGTPSYMAPEQARGLTEDIGTPADVYALGAILYELLTGRPPFQAETSLLTIEQVVNAEPTRPRTLHPGTPLDLETICLKCLEKDPERRYGSALALAEDLERFRAAEPILARRTGPVERAVKWARRRPAIAALIGVIFLAGVTLLAGGVWTYVTLRESARQTEESFQDALDAVNQMLIEVAEVDLVEVPQMTEKRRELLLRARDFYQRFFERRGHDPRVRLECARALNRLGEIYFLLGELSSAEEAYRAVQGRLEQPDLAGAEGRELAYSWNGLGVVQKERGWFVEAEESFRAALRLRSSLERQYPEREQAQGDVATTWYELAALLDKLAGRDAEAEEAYRAARSYQASLVEKHPDRLGLRRELARTLNNQGIFLSRRGRREAGEAFIYAEESYTLLIQKSPRTPKYRHELARTQSNLASSYWKQGQVSWAGHYYRHSVETLTKLTEDFGSVMIYQQDYATARRNLGLFLREQRQPAEALREIQQALTIRERLARDYPTPEHRSKLAGALIDVGVLHEEAKSFAEAADAYRQSAAIREEMAAAQENVPEHQSALASVYSNWGRLLAAMGEWERAGAMVRKAIERQRKALAQRPQEATYLQHLRNDLAVLADVELQRQNHAAAAVAALELPTLMAEGFEEHLRAACFLVRCADLAEAQNSHSTCDEYARTAIGLLRQAVERGYKNFQELGAAPEFDLLRTREDFRRLLREIEDKAQTASG